MDSYETSATVELQGSIHVDGVPFAPGTEVEILISPKARTVSPANDQTLAESRQRMQALFASIEGFRLGAKLSREELYERRNIH